VRVWIEDFDIEISAKHNLLQDSLFQELCSRIEQGEFQILIAGPPCGTFSRARHSGPPGPEPARSRQHIWGLPDLSLSNRKQIDQANKLVWRTIQLCRLIHDAKGVFILEHPEDPGDPFPSIFASPELADLISYTHAISVSCCQCMYGAPSRKAARLVGTAPGLDRLNAMCIHRKHKLVLKGLNSEGVFFIAAAQQYPPKFNEALVAASVAKSEDLPNTTCVQGPEGVVREPPGL